MIYDIKKSWAQNLEDGPMFSGEYPPLVAVDPVNFLGFTLNSPLGIPAGPLLDSQWTTLASRLGFDVVTYKTIRTQKYLGHPLPNVIFVESRDGTAHEVSDGNSITNSFGMPSMDPDYLRMDILKARQQLKDNQMLIVSVVGTPGNANSVQDDFVNCARLAEESGAHVVEANFSCPNICSKEGALFTDPHNAGMIAEAIVKAMKVPVMIKVGGYRDESLLRQVLINLAKAGVRGVCGINSVSMNVVNANGQPALGKGRESSGICGDMIRSEALRFVKMARKIIDQDKLDLELAGCGGMMHPEHFDEMLSSGAQVVMTATGMMWNPYLAYEWKEVKAKLGMRQH